MYNNGTSTVRVCCIDPLFSCAVWADCSDESCWYGHTEIVQYLVEETTAQVNATDDVSYSNSVKCIIVHWVLVHKHKYHW